MQQAIPIEELICPITKDWLEDPISLPCCGQAISRLAMVTHLQSSYECPLCRNDLSNYDAMNAPKSANINYLVEQAKNNNLVQNERIQKNSISKTSEESNQWVAKLYRLSTDNVYQTIIGKLEISNMNPNFNFKTLLIPVIDKSGSMSGSPIKQVQYSLNRIIDLTYKNSQILTNMVTYDDRGATTELNRSIPMEHYREIVSKIQGGGGTSFKSAFDEVIKICKKYQSDTDISSMVIIFLTDGEDSSYAKSQRSKLVESFKSEIASNWNKNYTVHSVGFGSQHDYDFLNNLRQIGSSEGAYRYADPSEDSDSLSNKINSLLDVIATSSSIPIKILNTNPAIQIINGDNDKYWIDLTQANLIQNHEITIMVNEKEQITLPIQVTEYENEKDDQLKLQWYAYLVDEIASEILVVSQKSDSIDKNLHCELLMLRSRSILSRLENSNPDFCRLEKLMESIQTVQKGGSVNQLKLNDLKFEGKYATKSVTGNNLLPALPSLSTQNNNIQYKVRRTGPWQIMDKPYLQRCSYSLNPRELFKIIGQCSTNEATNWIENNPSMWLNDRDHNGSNLLMICSSIGRYKLVETIINIAIDQINYNNNCGYNAIDLSILYGYWKTYDLLYSKGLKPTIDGSILLRTCLSKRYYNLANRLIKHKICHITDDLIDNAPTNEILEWLSHNSEKEINVETAIIKGMYDVVNQNLEKIGKISWNQFKDIFMKSSDEHIKIVELLIDNGNADANEIIEIVNENGEKEITWPLFISCEKGNLQMVQLLSKYLTANMINMQNNKGTTALWIAACNRHIDVVMEVLQLGADPNLPNYKGDSPLIPCCQKGSDNIVELLLEAGAKLGVYNKNRDNPIIICCRTGQSKILEMLLKRLTMDERIAMLSQCADIDGFNPLLAATELEKVECIKVCHKYGANLEFRTSDDNAILPGATALHLACFYKRLAAVKTLCDLGANIYSQTTINGYNPLHISIRQGDSNITRYLINIDKQKKNFNMTDREGRLPSYYANMNGNELILEEFFTNKLSSYLSQMLVTSPEIQDKCSQILIKYGKSPGCYEYRDITEIDLGKGMTLMSQAIITGNQNITDTLRKMNCDFYKKDDYGIPPIFWAAYLGHDLSGLSLDDQTVGMIEAIDKVNKINFQNKLLTNLSNCPQIQSSEVNPINTLVKMNHGYSSNINESTLTLLRKSRSNNHSLLGFMDKLKSNKVFPDGKQYLEYIIWDAKIHLVKLIASGENLLQPIHLMALYLYTGNFNIYQQVNYTLANWTHNSFWHPFICCLYQALYLLPEYKGEVYRAVDCQFNCNEYAIGNQIQWNTFSLCSSEWKNSTQLISDKKGIIFIIKSQTAKSISKYSKYPVDSEVIFLPGTRFIITDHYVGNIIALGQSNIRKTTYKAKEKDYEKAMNGQMCLIVELEEITDPLNLIMNN